MIAAGLAILAGLGALAWYLQRPVPRDLRLSFARLLSDLPVAPRPVPRLALMLPVRSSAFWLHLLAVVLALAAIWADLQLRLTTSDPRIGLRIVLDVSHGMTTVAEGVSRLDLVRAAAREEAEVARGAAGSAPYCGEVILAARTLRRITLSDLDRVEALPEGAYALSLMEAAKQEDAGCAITHVTVLSDLPLPPGAWPSDAPPLRWVQVGASVPNAGLSEVRLVPAQLDGTPASLMVTVDTFGVAAVPTVVIESPVGEVRPPVVPSLDRPGRFVAWMVPNAAGVHVARLEVGGAYRGDDQVIFDLTAPDALAIDWRLPGVPVPRGVQRSEGATLFVAPLAGLDDLPSDVAVLAVYPGWAGAGPRAIGAFVEDRELLDAINLDVLERRMPLPIPLPLPPGFVQVLTDAAGGVVLARRTDPPGLIVPQPVRDADLDITALSLTLFYSALQDLSGGAETPLALRWESPGGEIVSEAWTESDTARPLMPAPPPADYAVLPAEAPDQPVWPLLLLVALAALLAERLLALRGRRSSVL
jgi:hypothetical protein